MSATGKQNFIHQIFDLFLAITVVVYVVPTVKHGLFPTQMTRIEKMLRNSKLKRYHLAVDRKDELEMILTAFDGGESISAQIYRDVIRELDPIGDSRVFFTIAINRNSDEVFYLTRVRLEADTDLKQLRHLEITVCDHIKNQTGTVRCDGHEPIYECEVPIKKITASAAE